MMKDKSRLKSRRPASLPGFDLSRIIKQMAGGKLPVLSEIERKNIRELISRTVSEAEFLQKPTDPMQLAVCGLVSERLRSTEILLRMLKATVQLQTSANGRKHGPHLNPEGQRALAELRKGIRDLRVAIEPPEFIPRAFESLANLGNRLIAIRENFVRARGKSCKCQINWTELQSEIEAAIDYADSSHARLVEIANELKTRSELSTPPRCRPARKVRVAPATSDARTTQGKGGSTVL
jgi:hypothetical protein